MATALDTPTGPGKAPVPAHVPAGRVVDVDIYALPGQEEDFHAAWQALQAASPPIVWTPRNEGHWIALSGAVMAEVQADHERFSNRVIVIPKSVGEQHGLIPTTIDPPEHRPYRLLLNARLHPNAIRNMKGHIRAAAVDLIEQFAAAGRCDFTHDYAQQFPIRIFMGLVDLPLSDIGDIRLWAESMTRPQPVMPFGDAKAAFYRYLDPIIAARRDQPGEDLLSQMITADLGDGRRLSHDEALALCTQVLIAGVDTVVNFLGFVMLHLARNPAQQAKLGADPAGILPAVHELFRRFGLVTIAREVKADTEFHGVELKAGDMVCIPTQVHGLDETINPEALLVDFARARARHSAFGSGPHMCPGQELARAEVAITLEEWLARIPAFRLAPDADVRNLGGIVGQVARVVLEWDVEPAGA